MIAQVLSRISHSRRALIALCVALAVPRAGSAGAATEREPIAIIPREDGLRAPLTLAMGRVVLRPGAGVWAGTPTGARIIVVEAGVLAVEVTTEANHPLTATELSVVKSGPVARDELLIPAGTTMTFGAASVVSVRNPGVRPMVALDVAVYPEEPRPLARAFTTDDGVSFQLLASANAAAAPVGKIAVTLERFRLGGGAAMPAERQRGLTLLYLEAGTLEVTASAGEVSIARAAASAPYSIPGGLRRMAEGLSLAVTAGGVVYLALGAAAGMVNRGNRPVDVLTLSVSEAP